MLAAFVGVVPVSHSLGCLAVHFALSPKHEAPGFSEPANSTGEPGTKPLATVGCESLVGDAPPFLGHGCSHLPRTSRARTSTPRVEKPHTHHVRGYVQKLMGKMELQVHFGANKSEIHAIFCIIYIFRELWKTPCIRVLKCFAPK